MIYPKNFEQKLGFDTIQELIAENCISSMGLFYVSKIRFSNKYEVVRSLLAQADEFMQITENALQFPSNNYFDLRDELSRIKLQGTYIEQDKLFDLKSSLVTINEILEFFEKTEVDEFPELKKLTSNIYVPEDIIRQCEKIIDDKGEIKDNASSKLSEIRQKMNQKARQVLKETKRAFEQARKSGLVPENTEMTVRNGRSVIPLKASEKRTIGGFIHDESSTGQTVFVEPAASFELNNQIRELENEERREIIKILLDFTDNLRPFSGELWSAYRLLGLMDFIRAKALFSKKINASVPVISTDSDIILKNAYHPLLWLNHKRHDKDVVPLSLELNKDGRILIISGPNAGGKSVCLKTMGLLQFMLQCGLPVPASPNSEFRIFQNLFIDIGDEQSLENDLSTYSSHLLNMKQFLRHANAETLFMIDEFGTGTEPQLGGAIAEATLENLNKKEAYGLITTHYSNLKILAGRAKGLVNGAMLFDSEEMKPLYKLSIGKPGSSFAFEIAKKIGFPNYVLNSARKKSGGKHIRFDQQLQQLETDKLKLEQQMQKVESEDDKLSSVMEKYTLLLNSLEKDKKQIIAEAKLEAKQIIEDSNKAVERTIREIKEANAEKEKTKKLRADLEKTKNEIEKKEVDRTKKKAKKTAPKAKVKIVKPKAAKKVSPSARPIKGDFVHLTGTDIHGELLSVSGNDAVLNVNNIKLKASYNKLEFSNKTAPKPKSVKSSFSNISRDINRKAANFKLSLDIRGKRVDEALSELQRYIDDAMILSVKEVSILHGKGNGILRPIIREYLQSVKEIQYFGDASLERGGAGITNVVFK